MDPHIYNNDGSIAEPLDSVISPPLPSPRAPVNSKEWPHSHPAHHRQNDGLDAERGLEVGATSPLGEEFAKAKGVLEQSRLLLLLPPPQLINNEVRM